LRVPRRYGILETPQRSPRVRMAALRFFARFGYAPTMMAGLNVLAVYLIGWPGSRYLPLGLLAVALSVALSGMMIAVPIHGRPTRVRIALSLFVVILAAWVSNLVLIVAHFLGVALP